VFLLTLYFDVAFFIAVFFTEGCFLGRAAVGLTLKFGFFVAATA
jgi:hypothetical protein